MNRDEASRQQQDSVDWDDLETSIEINTRAKVDRIVETLPPRLKVSRDRAHDHEFRASAR